MLVRLHVNSETIHCVGSLDQSSMKKGMSLSDMGSKNLEPRPDWSPLEFISIFPNKHSM